MYSLFGIYLFDMCASQQVGARGYTTPTGFWVFFCIIILSLPPLLYSIQSEGYPAVYPHARNGIMLEVYGF